jgi:hypothetical protein
MTFDPDERFTLHPLTGEKTLRKLLGVEDDEDSVSDEPEEQETDTPRLF